MKNTIPFEMLEMDKAHQTPFKPRAVFPNIIAKGILIAVRTTVITEAYIVLPRPDIAPTVISSMHINISHTPIILR